jgi:hypothetical protein
MHHSPQYACYADKCSCSVGPAPYNILTKFASLNLDYQTTPDYVCDMEDALCEVSEGASLTALVTEAIA